MDISLLTNRVICDFSNNWILSQPYEEPEHQINLTAIPKCTIINEKDEIEDAMITVKMDPAVLEVQIKKQDEQIPKQSDGIIMRRRESHREKPSFERMMDLHKNSLLSLDFDQFDLLMKFVATLRQQRVSVQKYLECGFCKNNGESVSWYSSHALRDGRGRVRCPVLRALRCPRCGATGDRAHTIRHCCKKDWKQTPQIRGPDLVRGQWNWGNSTVPIYGREDALYQMFRFYGWHRRPHGRIRKVPEGRR